MNFDYNYVDYLDEKGIAEIQALEKDIGKLLIAYPTPSLPGHLSKEHLNKLRDLEKKLCVRLVAYETFG